MPAFRVSASMMVKRVSVWISELKRTPRSAPVAISAAPLTLKPPEVPFAGSSVTISAPSAPTLRPVTSNWPEWRASSVPLEMLMSSRPSALDSFPVTTAPPEMDSVSAPAPNEISPVTVPLRMSSTSAPEPRRISPWMAGSLLSGTPSLSASGNSVPGTTTPSWMKETPVVLLLRSTATALPVWSISAVGLMPEAITPVLRKLLSVPESSLIATASVLEPPTPAVI
ncbi:hypothetical protein D3C86_1410890 [compost metagenome]